MGNDRDDLSIQRQVYRNVERRGYLEGRTPFDIVRNQLIKSIEELGECARAVFDGEYPPVEEWADLVIPAFTACEECGYDLLAEVVGKSGADIERGVRK